MRILINTNYSAAGTVVLDGLAQRLSADGHQIVRNEWDRFEGVDIVLFAAPDSKVRESKRLHDGLVCGIFDPKATLSWQRKEARAADFLVVSSIEQREFFLRFNKNIFIYYMFPDAPRIPKEHVQKDIVVIGYHGNKQHLDAMKDVSWALDELAKKHHIAFHAIYNKEKLGTWKRNVPRRCPVHHVQWTQSFTDQLKECDIGICPSITPVGIVGKALARPLRSYLYNPEGYINQDHVLRFKPSNNPGRIHVFSELGIPVVADFSPSSCQVIEDGVSGFLAGTKEGWLRALDLLVFDAKLRASMSEKLRSRMDEQYSPAVTYQKFLQFLALHRYGQ